MSSVYNSVFGYGDDAEQDNPQQGGCDDAQAELFHTNSSTMPSSSAVMSNAPACQKNPVISAVPATILNALFTMLT